MEDCKVAPSDKPMLSGLRVMKKPKRCGSWAEPKIRASLRCQRHGAGPLPNPKLRKVYEVERSTKQKLQGKDKGGEDEGSCVSCGGGRICKLCREAVQVMVPAVETGVEGIWSVVSLAKSSDALAVVPSHFSNHMFWRAQWPVQFGSISDYETMMQSTAFGCEEEL